MSFGDQVDTKINRKVDVIEAYTWGPLENYKFRKDGSRRNKPVKAEGDVGISLHNGGHVSLSVAEAKEFYKGLGKVIKAASVKKKGK